MCACPPVLLHPIISLQGVNEFFPFPDTGHDVEELGISITFFKLCNS
jgi:hypothetical protein